MNISTKLAALALAVGLGCGLANATRAQSGDYDQALRELNIMRNIFSASMQSENNRRFNLGSAEAIYLANQGMVFTFDMPGRGWLDIPGLEKLQALNGGNFDFNFDFDFDYEGAEEFADDDPNANPAFADYQQQMRDFNEQMRDKQEEMREKQREMRDLQRAQRENDAADDSGLENLSDELEALSDELQQLSDSMNATQQTYDAERKAQLATIHQAYATRLFSTLCDYGTTLRSLSSGQHVSLVLQNHEENQVQVYVVDYNALASCSSGESLQQGAVNYTQTMR
jgi:hypothetical protein